MKLTKQDIYNYSKNMFLIIFGTAVLAFGTAIFIVPFNLVNGGVSGMAIVLEHIIPIEVGVDFYITALTWILFILGLVVLGKGFAIKTLISTIFYPLMFSLFYNLVENQSLGGIFVLQNSEYGDIAILLAAVFGGASVGAGCAITFILSFLVCKIFKNLKSSHVIFAIDAGIVLLGVFVIGDIVVSLLGISSAFICALVIDRVFFGSSTAAYVAQIVSNKSEEISRGVIEQMDRTTTIVDVIGAYSKEPKKMIIVSFSIREYSDLMNIINREDPSAFMTIARAHENHGEGWTQEKK